MALPALPLLAGSPTGARAALWPLVRAEATRLGVPPALADAVAIIETGYTPGAVGSSGEIGMMQVMPGTARMLGFTGAMADLFVPATNIHYGVTYLAHAWAVSGGNACRALMKYRAGVGEEGFTPLSIQYCRRAVAWLAAQDPALAQNVSLHTPLVATLSDRMVTNVNGRPFHADLAALMEIADVPGLVVEGAPRASAGAGARASAAPAVRGWHMSGQGRGAHIQAVVDAALADGGDPHEIHVAGEAQ